MQFKSIHMKDRPWEYFQDRNSFPLRRKDLLNFETCGCTEFVYGYAELQPGETIPLHLNRQAECDFILSGRAWVRLGKRKVEIREKTGIYFPSGYPHSYEVIGKEPLRFFYAFATEKYGQEIGFEFASEKSANSIDIVNMWKQRWAVVDDFEPWQLWEPSKGFWGMSWKTLFDAELGNCNEMFFGTCFLPPGCRYSLHKHENSEIYYVLAGQGQIFVGDETILVEPGTAIYVPGCSVHGAQNINSEPLRMIWIYNTESASKDWTWTPVEDIFLDAQ